MSTRKPRRISSTQLATAAALGLLVFPLSTGASAGAAGEPVAHSAEAIARISRSELRRTMRRRAADAAAVRRARRALRRCRRAHPRHCRPRRRALRRARRRLKHNELLIGRLRARLASTEHSSRQPSASTPSDAGSDFGEPFVKGVDSNIEGWGTEAAPQIASEMRTLGVDWAREDLEWSQVEPRPGVFDWSRFDQLIAAAKANGITILPIVGYAPSWASPTDASAYAAFVKAAVERYGPGTAADLRWWELWNEPYYSYAWSGRTPEPQAYARDAVAAAQAAKSVAPSVKLLISADYDDATQTGGSSHWQTSWIDDMFAAEPSLGQWIDGVSVHPYGDDPALPVTQPGGWRDARGNWSFQRIDSIRARFLAHGVNVPFWITEVGWSTEEVSEAQQASDYADLIPQVADRSWIRALFPYCLREFEETPNKESQFGLLRYGSWQPKAAFAALQHGFAALG